MDLGTGLDIVVVLLELRATEGQASHQVACSQFLGSPADSSEVSEMKAHPKPLVCLDSKVKVCVCGGAS